MDAKKPMVAAIIAARGGSKGLPRKNLHILVDKPLICHTIEHAKASGVCDVVIVTTEDEEIAEAARKYGAYIIKRPAELAGDFVPAEPAIQHALITYESLNHCKIDIVVYLQTTDVFRQPQIIKECVQRLIAHPELDSVFSAYLTHKNFWRKTKEGYIRLTPDLSHGPPRQLREPIYREDTGIACATRAHFVREGRRIGDKIDIVPTDDFATSIDIHDAFSFWLAEKIKSEWSLEISDREPGMWLGTELKSWSQSIRNGYARAFILFALHETGVFEVLRNQGSKTSAELATICKIDAYLLDGVLNFLYYADKVLLKKDNKFLLSDYGKDWLFQDMVLTMAYGAIGAYACLLYELVPSLRGEKRYGRDFLRRGDLIAKASYLTGKANYPWVVQEFKILGIKTVADLGCGSADILIDFCKQDPNLKGIGIDIAPGALEEAGRRIEAAGLTERIKLTQGDITDPKTYYPKVKQADAFNAIMVFHEFLRDGEKAVEDILKKMKENFPGKYIFLGEFNRISDAEFQAMPYPERIHPLFYQYIIHPLTWQGLPLEKERWLKLFAKAGLEIVKVKDDFPFRLVEYILRF